MQMHPATRPQALGSPGWSRMARPMGPSQAPLPARILPLMCAQADPTIDADRLQAAWTLLQDFTRKEARGLAQPMLDSAEKRAALRAALLAAAAHPWPPSGYSAGSEVLLGIMASDVRLAVRSLRDYCAALGLPFVAPVSRVPGTPALPAVRGAVYVKYNSGSGLCYASAYDGRDRGVLVTLAADQVGHLPLGLFDEAMQRSFELPG